MSSPEEPISQPDFGDLFGSEDEASDIDDGRSESPKQQPQTTPSQASNLFGSDEEEEQPRQILRQHRSHDSDSDEREERRDYSDQEDDRYDQYNSQGRKKDVVEVALHMPQLPLPYSDNNKYYLAKLPRFLDVEVDPFVPEEFNTKIEEGLTPAQERESIREQIENTIRWRRIINEHGEECFDVGSKPVGADEHVFLLAHQTESGALESQVEFTDHMTFRPSGLTSDTHRHITAQIADRQVKKHKTKMYYTEKDPELMKQELELQEAERLKAQKKLESQRKKADMRYTDSARRREFGDYDTADDYGYHQINRAQDRYEDDFVIDDDDYDEEEERLRESRLAQAKRAGMDRYKRQHDDEIEEEEEEYGDEDEDEDEEIVIRRAKRNRIASDEDD
ncbi:hypothetical protein G6F21_009304 [Rhizopus arrhizus]|nr:hypothetical protein G6F21_009304 [Rhizopus arrhizus]